MRTLVEVPGEGLDGMLNKEVVIWCLNFIYSGTLVGVNDTFVKLENAGVVYDTGPLSESAKTFKVFEKMPKNNPLYIRTQMIEAFYLK